MKNELSTEFTRIEDTNYAVNELGQIKNLKTGNSISTFLVSGYPAFNILHKGKRKVVYLHHMMALVFLDYVAKRGLISINHRDQCKENPRLDNLEIISHRRNSALTYISRNRTLPTGVTKTSIGKRRYKAQISYLGINRYLGCYMTPEEASKVYEEAASTILKNGELPEYFLTRERYERFKKPE